MDHFEKIYQQEENFLKCVVSQEKIKKF